MGQTDPLAIADGKPIAVGSATWLLVDLGVLDGVGRSQVAYRDSDGVTLKADGPSLTELVRVAESLAASP